MSILSDLYQKAIDTHRAVQDKIFGLSTADKKSAADLADAQAASEAAAEAASNLAAELKAQREATEQESEASAEALNAEELARHQ